MVSFIWQPWNLEHLARHGVSPELVEAIFQSEDFIVSEPSSHPHREIAFGTVAGKTWKIVFIRSADGEIFPITAHRVDPKRKR